MEKTTLAAINIVNKKSNTLLSKHFPLIFDWNGEGAVLKEITENKKFYDYVVEIGSLTIENYTFADMCMTYFGKMDEDESNDDLKELRYPIQFLYEAYRLEREFHFDIAPVFLIKIYHDIFARAFNNEQKYVPSDTIKDNVYEQIKDMHNKIHAKYGDNFILSTEINYVRSQLAKVYEMHDINQQFIIEKLSNILGA